MTAPNHTDPAARLRDLLAAREAADGAVTQAAKAMAYLDEEILAGEKSLDVKRLKREQLRYNLDRQRETRARHDEALARAAEAIGGVPQATTTEPPAPEPATLYACPVCGTHRVRHESRCLRCASGHAVPPFPAGVVPVPPPERIEEIVREATADALPPPPDCMADDDQRRERLAREAAAAPKEVARSTGDPERPTAEAKPKKPRKPRTPKQPALTPAEDDANFARLTADAPAKAAEEEVPADSPVPLSQQVEYLPGFAPDLPTATGGGL